MKIKHSLSKSMVFILMLSFQAFAQESADNNSLQQKIESLAQDVQMLKLGQGVFGEIGASKYGLAPAASKVYSIDKGVSIGGYGEFLYTAYEGKDEAGLPSGKDNQADFVRAITYVGYKFDSNWVFNSELEFEHASTSKSGSVSVEFAQLDYLYKPSLNFRVGMVLIPMGYINMLHEAPVYLSSLRPETEKRIIPSTWRENGLGVFGELGDHFRYQAYVVNSLNGADFDSNGFRSGRQKGSKALANDLSGVARLDYLQKGFNFGVSAYVGESGQNAVDINGNRLKAVTQIYEAHTDLKYKGLWLRGLFAMSALSDTEDLNATLGNVSNGIAKHMLGGYAELAYNVLRNTKSKAKLYPYVRYEHLNTQSKVLGTLQRDRSKIRNIMTFGAHFRPIDQIVFKSDYVLNKNKTDTAVSQFNLSFGYMF